MPEELARRVAAIADEKQAVDTVAFDMRGLVPDPTSSCLARAQTVPREGDARRRVRALEG